MPSRNGDGPGGSGRGAQSGAAGESFDIGDLPLIGSVDGKTGEPEAPTSDEPPEDAPTIIRDLASLGLAGGDSGEVGGRPATAAPHDDAASVPADQEVAAGEFIGGVKLVELIAGGQKVSCWRGQQADRTAVTVHVLYSGATDRETQWFVRGASRMGAIAREHPLRGIAKVLKVVPGRGVYMTDLAAAGTMDDLPMLNWTLPEKVAFFRRVCAAVGAVHASSHTHGCLRPANVLLDEELQPVVADVGVLDVHDSFTGKAASDNDYAPYCAPEVRKGAPTSNRSDVYSLGRLLYFLLLGAHPADPDEEIPLLASLVDVVPEGLARIVRRATTIDPSKRYAGVDELLEDMARHQSAELVGLAAPEEPTVVEAPARTAAKPPAARDSEATVRAPSAARTRPEVASRLAAAQARAPSESAVLASAARTVPEGPTDLATFRQKAVVVAMGLVAAGAGFGLPFSTGVETALASGLQLFGAVALSLVAPAFGGFVRGSRLMWAVLAAAAVVLLAPGSHAARAGRVAKLSSGSPQSRAAAVASLRAKGLVEFVDVDFSGANLDGQDLSFLVFDRSRFVGASLVGARLADSSFVDADLSDADLSGADLRGVDVSRALGWDRIRCSAETRMPAEWLCEEGKPASVRGFEAGLRASPSEPSER